MPKYLYFILIYALVVLIAVCVYLLASRIITLFFKAKEAHSKSVTFPIIKALTVLLTVYFVRHQIGSGILNSILNALNKYFNAGIAIPKPEESTASFIEAIIFYVIVGTIAVMYILFGLTRRQIILEEKAKIEESKALTKITFPEEPAQPSPIFHERIMNLFELKFEKEGLRLSYDKEYSILFGLHKYGLHTYCKVIYCHEYSDQSLITAEIVMRRIEVIKSELARVDMGDTPDIMEYYYVIEKGVAPVMPDKSVVCYSEDTLLNSLIDFSKYLRKLVDSFTTEHLPFSYTEKEEEKLTLSDTFIAPLYKLDGDDATVELDQSIDSWLVTVSYKQLVILGDYGMGKSTYLKYYASLLAKRILSSQQVVRIPVFISLTNVSPRHGGIDVSIGKFVSDNLGVSRELFNVLINRGKLVFLLDGFDEMGYVGTHEQRVKQLNAIWQLATRNNKILISGRPSYFPTEQELIQSLNIISEKKQYTPQDKPYFERIEFSGLSKEQIIESIERSKFSDNEKVQYKDFIFSNESILDLCRRPSMMHIIREMLPKLYAEYKNKTLNAGVLMTQYIDHWITRQLDKNIVSPVEDKKVKKEFVWELFIMLASSFYVKKIEKLPANEVVDICKEKLSKLQLSDQSDAEGFEAEILSGYFLEIEDGGFKFVHKSFKEFFIAKQIIYLLENKKLDDIIFTRGIWSREINDFVYDHFEAASQEEYNLFFINDRKAIRLKSRISAKLFGILRAERLFRYFQFRKKASFRRRIEYQIKAFVCNVIVSLLLFSTIAYGRKTFLGFFSLFLSINSPFPNRYWRYTDLNTIITGYYYAQLRAKSKGEKVNINRGIEKVIRGDMFYEFMKKISQQEKNRSSKQDVSKIENNTSK